VERVLTKVRVDRHVDQGEVGAINEATAKLGAAQELTEAAELVELDWHGTSFALSPAMSQVLIGLRMSTERFCIASCDALRATH